MVVSKIGSFLLSFALSVGLLGCQPLTYLSLAFPTSASIGQLQGKEKGENVYVSGIVAEKVPFLENGAYLLKDTTGQVWVITQDLLPQAGEEIALKGTVEYQSIPVEGQELGEFYLVELEKVANVPAQEPNSPIPSQIEVKPPNDIIIEPPASPSSKPQPPANSPLLPDDLFLPHKQNAK